MAFRLGRSFSPVNVGDCGAHLEHRLDVHPGATRPILVVRVMSYEGLRIPFHLVPFLLPYPEVKSKETSLFGYSSPDRKGGSSPFFSLVQDLFGSSFGLVSMDCICVGLIQVWRLSLITGVSSHTILLLREVNGHLRSRTFPSFTLKSVSQLFLTLIICEVGCVMSTRLRACLRCTTNYSDRFADDDKPLDVLRSSNM
ncbi:hypothetical protein U1Q18_036247 [Sarracenia purpurea var. burkii]